MKESILGVVVMTVLLTACDTKNTMKPIALHPQNPHYFLYQDKPTILITSAEHYGAVLNLDFDYVVYLDELARNSLNLTRTFTGAYVEPEGAFRIEQNTMAPLQERFICPWRRSETPGYAHGGNKFDLNEWDDEYFKRLKNFLSEAEKRKIVVELALFCPFYEELQWSLSPLNAVNNINGISPTDRTHVYTLDKSKGLLEVQEKLVRKIVNELKDYSNLIYEICNEPYFGGVTMEWQHYIASLIRDEEKVFPSQHLISQNIANEKLKIENPHPAVSLFNFHYAYPPVTIAENFHLNKAIGNNETGFRGNADSTYRKEGWGFIIAGGALYNNLDYSFTAASENGIFTYPETQPGGGSSSLRNQLEYLKDFMAGFDFLKMKPDSSVVSKGFSLYKKSQTLAEVGRQYAIYIFGKGPLQVELTIPAGTYALQFMDPLTGKYEDQQKVTSHGTVSFTTPGYREDVAIKLTADSTSK